MAACLAAGLAAHMNEGRIKIVQRVIQQGDMDQDGVLSKEEVDTQLRTNPQFVNAVFDMLDADGDGEVTIRSSRATARPGHANKNNRGMMLGAEEVDEPLRTNPASAEVRRLRSRGVLREEFDERLRTNPEFAEAAFDALERSGDLADVLLSAERGWTSERRGPHKDALTQKTYTPDKHPDGQRFKLAEGASWDVEGYTPTDYTAAVVTMFQPGCGKPICWADPADCKDDGCQWNRFQKIDGKPTTFENDGTIMTFTDKKYKGCPKNPVGPTGMVGRGLLGTWGPNFAADPIVTIYDKNKLKMIVIKRADTDEWAIPGGMVDPGETAFKAAFRELGEEAGAKLKMDSATEIYSGYVDDPRNTDNAWMETRVYHVHLQDLGITEPLELKADPNETRGAKWMTIAEWSDDGFEATKAKLYASHADFVAKVVANMAQKGAPPA